MGDGPVITPVSHAVFALAALALLAVEVRRLPKPVERTAPETRADERAAHLGSSSRESLDMPRV
jgi:hypothetical protein